MSSIKYSKYREGKAIKIKITIGTTVQIVSKRWESIEYLSWRGAVLR
jgi:hypothetical protein